MSKRSQDKRRARAKEKKQNKRREQGISPLSRLAGVAEDACECWSSYAEEDGGIRSVTVMRPVRGGGHVAAFFLIDYDCIGLKDAFVRLNVDAFELRETLRARSLSEGVRLVHITTQDAQRMLASAIRWTLDHPFFRLPTDAERCLKIVGGAGDVENAVVRDFGTEDGGLLYIGRQRDLERRLVGMTVEEFIKRDDVEYEFADELYDELDREAGSDLAERDENEEASDMLEEMQQEIKKKMLEGIRRWCLANGQAPHPEIDRVVDLMLTASREGMLADTAEVDEEEISDSSISEEGTKAALEAEKALLSLETPAEQAQLAAAQKQLNGYMESFGSMADMIASLQLDPPAK